MFTVKNEKDIMKNEQPKGPFCQTCGMPLNKPEDFARTVVRILNKTEKISEMKKNQITSAKQNFNQETIAGKWQEIYKQVINEGQKQD